MNWFWHAMFICLVVIPVTVLWVACIVDVIFRRHDLVWWKRLCYLLLIIFIPLFGALIYASVMFARSGRGTMDTEGIEGMRAEGVVADQYQSRDRLEAYRAMYPSGE